MGQKSSRSERALQTVDDVADAELLERLRVWTGPHDDEREQHCAEIVASDQSVFLFDFIQEGGRRVPAVGDDTRSVVKALEILESVCLFNDLLEDLFADRTRVAALISLGRRFAFDNGVVLGVIKVFVNVSCLESLRDCIVEAGGVEWCIGRVSACINAEDADIARHAIMLCSNLSVSQAIRPVLLGEGLLEALVAIGQAERGIPCLQQAAMVMINICCEESLLQTIMDSGICKYIIEWFESWDGTLKFKAVQSLANLINDLTLGSKLIRLGILHPLSVALAFGHFEELKEQSLYVLYRLSCVVGNRKEIVRLRFIQPLIDVMEEPHDEMELKWALLCTANLLDRKSERPEKERDDAMHSFIDRGGLAHLIRHVMNEEATTHVKQAAGIALHMAANSTCGILHALNAGGIKAFKKLTMDSDEDVQDLGKGALATLMTDKFAEKDELTEEEEVIIQRRGQLWSQHETLWEARDFERASLATIELAELVPWDAAYPQYATASCWARMEGKKPREILELLLEAGKNGFRDIEYFAKDDDFLCWKDDPEFAALYEQVHQAIASEADTDVKVTQEDDI